MMSMREGREVEIRSSKRKQRRWKKCSSKSESAQLSSRYCWSWQNPSKRQEIGSKAYLGPPIDRSEIAKALDLVE